MAEARALTGAIFDIDETALHDGPGVRMTVYLKGCPLRCVWCHSPESQAHGPEVVWFESRCAHCGRCLRVCPQHKRRPGLSDPEDRARCTVCGACVAVCPGGALEIRGREVSAGEIVERAQRLRPFFARTGGGVTLTGGEPTAQPQFALAIARLCHDAGLHVAVETCGFAPWGTLAALAETVDLFLFDVKHPDASAHKELTGASNEPILANLRRLLETGAEVVVRVPLIPRVNDDAGTIEKLARLVVGLGAARIELLPFNPATGGKYSWVGRPNPMPDAKRQSPEAIAPLAAICAACGLEVL